MQNTVNNHAERYYTFHPTKQHNYYSCADCGELVSDRFLHDKHHRERSLNPVIVFAKMSEIVTILWGDDGS